jgi:hypothetical protein
MFEFFISMLHSEACAVPTGRKRCAARSVARKDCVQFTEFSDGFLDTRLQGGSIMARAHVLLVFVLGCGVTPRPDDMSAAAHRAEATEEKQAARAQLADFRPERPALGVLVPNRPDRGPSELQSAVYNPTQDHVHLAHAHLEHAAAHERAAAELERFEDGACGPIPSAERGACPLLVGVALLADVPGGVRLGFDPSVDVGAVVARMRCHLAYARTRHFEMAGCPLYTPGLTIARAATHVVDLIAADVTGVATLRQRAREEVVRVPR